MASRKKKEPTTQVFTLIAPLIVSIRARNKEDAKAIVDRIDWSLKAPVDLDNGVFFIKGSERLSCIEAEEMLDMAEEPTDE